MQDVYKHFRISRDLDKRISGYCKLKNISNESELLRRAIIKEITPDISDELLTFESLKDLHSKMQRLENELSIFFNFFCYFTKHFFVYNPELPPETMNTAAISAKKRYEEMFQEFQKSMQNSPSIFQSMLADYFEERIEE